MNMHNWLIVLFTLLVGSSAAVVLLHDGSKPGWSATELQLIRSLWLGSLRPLPSNPSNAVADDRRAAALGHRLFFDTRLSGDGRVACSSCHQPERYFTDGLAVSIGAGISDHNAPSVVASAFSPWYFWDGRKDSLWSQALAPLENAAEHDTSRTQIALLFATDSAYRDAYEEIFGALPSIAETAHYPQRASPLGASDLRSAWRSMATKDQAAVNLIFTNVGKALEAYQRLLLPGTTKFDRYAEAQLTDSVAPDYFSEQEVSGLRLFIGAGQCINCHNGPLFTNNSFHNTAVLPAAGRVPSKGRHDVLTSIVADPFNCLGSYNDGDHDSCQELRFMKKDDELIGAHRTPSLRNVLNTGPYMHAGQMTTISEILDQYNRAPEALVGHNEAKPLGLSGRELEHLEIFLHTLNGSVAADPRWLRAPIPHGV
jgi:cytochrome c peroxidase